MESFMTRKLKHVQSLLKIGRHFDRQCHWYQPLTCSTADSDSFQFENQLLTPPPHTCPDFRTIYGHLILFLYFYFCSLIFCLCLNFNIIWVRWIMRSAECGVRSVENEECGKCGVWKMRSVENEECVLLIFNSFVFSLLIIS